MTVSAAEGRDKQGVSMRYAGSVSYSAATESAASRDTDNTPSPFAQRAYREARRHHRSPLLQAQRPLGVLLGMTLNDHTAVISQILAYALAGLRGAGQGRGDVEQALADDLAPPPPELFGQRRLAPRDHPARQAFDGPAGGEQLRR